ncbi:glutathione S-transferase family protein [Roseomonas sp. AR75]|uniref:glutathione S-transferase family protein n=1 Tax=Roseomonas sp. AR75 TaxID=2562311 RepID=UPI0010C13577|nr:glutathione S-transferase family protein [Roseomonas sp. AR75]
MARTLYELCGWDPARIFSPYCWRARMALAHKGLDFESVPWRFTETDRLAFAKHDKVPVLVDGDRTVADSWAIAQYLDDAYPDAPSLLHGHPASYIFVAAWNDAIVQAGIGRLVVSDIPALLGEKERAYFVESREKRFGMTLEAVTADREERLPAFRASLQPVRMMLRAQPFFGGDAPDYADMIVFGSFMWARSVSPLRLLEPDDPVSDWRERMLDLHGGMARQAPCFGA